MRRVVLPAVVVCIAAALIALLAFGVSGQGANGSIDSALARGLRPTVPDARMALPRSGRSREREHRRLPRQGGRRSTCSPRGASPARPRRRSSSGPQHRWPAQRHRARRHLPGQLRPPPSSSSATSTSPIRCVRDVSGNFVRSFGTTGVPETFVINRQGRIQALRRYQLTGSGSSRRCRGDPGRTRHEARGSSPAVAAALLALALPAGPAAARGRRRAPR